MSVVSVQSISKRYGSRHALEDVSFELGGGITGLLGPNGAGKTTLLRCLATVLAPDSGEISVLGFDPDRPGERTEIRRRIGYMPQEPGFYRNFTVFDFLDYIAILKEEVDRPARHSDVRRVLGLVGLENRSMDKIKKLSGGMRQRLALAQALLDEPKLLLLDEPTAGLDPEQRLRFRDMLSRLSEFGSVLLSTHQTEDVAALCDRVVVLDDGRVRFDGTPRELTSQAAGKVWLVPERPAEARVSWRTTDGLYRGVGEPPANAEPIEPTIEDAYLLLVGAAALSPTDEAV